MTATGSAGPVEQLLDINQEILIKESRLRTQRALRRAARFAAAAGPLLLVATYAAYIINAGTYDIAAVNIPLLVLGVVLIVGALVYLVYIADPKSESVARLQLDLNLLLERKKIRAAELQVGRDYRRSSYKDDVQSILEQYRHESLRYRRVHNILQSFIIIGSLSTTAFAGVAVDTGPFRWAAAGSSFVVGISAGFTGYYKFRERSFYLQQTADAIEQEWTAVELGIGRYLDLDDVTALGEFVHEVERLRAEQRMREQNLDQPSEQKDPTG